MESIKSEKLVPEKEYWDDPFDKYEFGVFLDAEAEGEADRYLRPGEKCEFKVTLQDELTKMKFVKDGQAHEENP